MNQEQIVYGLKNLAELADSTARVLRVVADACGELAPAEQTADDFARLQKCMTDSTDLACDTLDKLKTCLRELRGFLETQTLHRPGNGGITELN